MNGRRGRYSCQTYAMRSRTPPPASDAAASDANGADDGPVLPVMLGSAGRSNRATFETA
jgi:hypothetical protein